MLQLHRLNNPSNVIDMNQCSACLIRNRAICADLDASELDALNKIGHQQQIERGRSLMWEGEDAHLVANVIDGVMKLTSSLEDGREQIVGLVYPSDFIGRPYGTTSAQTVTAITDTKLCVFPRSAFDDFAKSHPRLEHKLLDKTLSELDRARQWMLLLGRKSASEKIASFLLEMSERLAEKGCTDIPARSSFELPFGRQQVADILGLTIETVSRQFTRLKKQGLIDLPDRRTVVILDREALAVEA